MALTLRSVPVGFRIFIVTLLIFAFFLGIPVFHYVIAVMIAIVINAFREELEIDESLLQGVDGPRVDHSVHQAAATD